MAPPNDPYQFEDELSAYGGGFGGVDSSGLDYGLYGDVGGGASGIDPESLASLLGGGSSAVDLSPRQSLSLSIGAMLPLLFAALGKGDVGLAAGAGGKALETGQKLFTQRNLRSAQDERLNRQLMVNKLFSAAQQEEKLKQQKSLQDEKLQFQAEQNQFNRESREGIAEMGRSTAAALNGMREDAKNRYDSEPATPAETMALKTQMLLHLDQLKGSPIEEQVRKSYAPYLADTYQFTRGEIKSLPSQFNQVRMGSQQEDRQRNKAESASLGAFVNTLDPDGSKNVVRPEPQRKALEEGQIGFTRSMNYAGKLLATYADKRLPQDLWRNPLEVPPGLSPEQQKIAGDIVSRRKQLLDGLVYELKGAGNRNAGAAFTESEQNFMYNIIGVRDISKLSMSGLKDRIAAGMQRANFRNNMRNFIEDETGRYLSSLGGANAALNIPYWEKDSNMAEALRIIKATRAGRSYLQMRGGL